MIELRRATAADALLLAKTRRIMWEETYRGIYPDAMLDEYDIGLYTKRDRERLKNPAHHYYLYLEGDTCVGYFSFGPYNFGCYQDFEMCLNNLYIRKGYKGLGLGKQAFETLRIYCAEHGIGKFFYGCHARNYPAICFYRHMGGVQGDSPNPEENIADEIIHFEFYLGEDT